MKRANACPARKRRRRLEDEEEEEDDKCWDESVSRIRDCVYFCGSVEKKYVLKLLQALDAASEYALNNVHWPSTARVYLYIHSGGGCAYSGLSAMDHIRNNRVPVTTIADGYVASAATFMLLAGEERKCMRNAKVLIHQLSTGFWGKFDELLDEVENSRDIMTSIRDAFKERTCLTEKQINGMLDKELHLSATRCLESGIVDEVW